MLLSIQQLIFPLIIITPLSVSLNEQTSREQSVSVKKHAHLSVTQIHLEFVWNRRGEERRGEERRLQTEQRTNSLVTQHASVETQLPSFQTLLKSPVCFSPWKKVSVVQMWILGHTTKSTYFTKSKQTVQLIIWYFEWKVCVATDDTGSSTQTSE